MRRMSILLAFLGGCGTTASTTDQRAPERTPAPPTRSVTTPDASVDADVADCSGPGCDQNRPRYVISSSSIEILGPIVFPVDSAEVYPDTLRMLDAIAATLDGNPDIRELEVQGHADENDANPDDISTQRAEIVRFLLIRAGVDPNRLTIRGLGVRAPGRRTVEFLIVRRR